jgi:hypothetical protein
MCTILVHVCFSNFCIKTIVLNTKTCHISFRFPDCFQKSQVHKQLFKNTFFLYVGGEKDFYFSEEIP